MSKLKSFIFILICLFFATCLENEAAEINLAQLTSKYIGKNGAIIIQAIPNDDKTKFKKDETRKICFQSQISDGRNEINVDCGFWKPLESTLYLFCNIGPNIPAGNYSISFFRAPKIEYQDYEIIFKNQYSKSNYEFEKLDRDLIDIYAEEQTINIEEGKDIYEVKFNVVSYNQEVLMIRYEPMDCKQEKNELICQIKKNALERRLESKSSYESVYYISDIISPGHVGLPLVEFIRIKDNIARKEEVFVGITRLLENVTENGVGFVYETNVTNINNIMTYGDHLILNFTNEYDNEDSGFCSFIKYDDNPLLMYCYPFYMFSLGKCWLKEIKDEKIIKDSHQRYNFRLQPFKNKEKIYYSKDDNGTSIDWVYPEILDFTKKDTLYIDYGSRHSRFIKGLTFNNDKEDLSCEIKQSGILRCTVPKNHFEGKKGGYYFTNYTNHLGGKSTYYAIRPIKVVLKGTIYSISIYYSLLLILIMF